MPVPLSQIQEEWLIFQSVQLLLAVRLKRQFPTSLSAEPEMGGVGIPDFQTCRTRNGKSTPAFLQCVIKTQGGVTVFVYAWL